MTEPVKYQVTVRGLVPAVVDEKLAQGQAEAAKARRDKEIRRTAAVFCAPKPSERNGLGDGDGHY